jgi:hypothetical protein
MKNRADVGAGTSLAVPDGQHLRDMHSARCAWGYAQRDLCLRIDQDVAWQTEAL